MNKWIIITWCKRSLRTVFYAFWLAPANLYFWDKSQMLVDYDWKVNFVDLLLCIFPCYGCVCNNRHFLICLICGKISVRQWPERWSWGFSCCWRRTEYTIPKICLSCIRIIFSWLFLRNHRHRKSSENQVEAIHL